MATVTPDAPVVLIPELTPLTREAVNRVVVDINTRFDRMYEIVAAIEVRLAAVEVKLAGRFRE